MDTSKEGEPLGILKLTSNEEKKDEWHIPRDMLGVIKTQIADVLVQTGIADKIADTFRSIDFMYG